MNNKLCYKREAWQPRVTTCVGLAFLLVFATSAESQFLSFEQAYTDEDGEDVPSNLKDSLKFTGESELTFVVGGVDAVSQYFFFDWKKVNALVRYAHVDGVLERGEFAVGPTLSVGNATWKLQFGGTTDEEVMTASTIVGSIGRHFVLHIADAKWATDSGLDTLYGKLFIGLSSKGAWQFRVENLLVDWQENRFLLIGFERRFKLPLPSDTHFYVAPMYDAVSKDFVTQAGFRFF